MSETEREWVEQKLDEARAEHNAAMDARKRLAGHFWLGRMNALQELLDDWPTDPDE